MSKCIANCYAIPVKLSPEKKKERQSNIDYIATISVASQEGLKKNNYRRNGNQEIGAIIWYLRMRGKKRYGILDSTVVAK